MNLLIRKEQPADKDAIFDLTARAFAGRPYAGGDEQFVVDQLRADGALTLSLVACMEDRIVGQVSFSPAQNEDNSEPWYALGPVSVLPDAQGKGIGARLIEDGLRALDGALGCILTGNPNYYTRFGFQHADAYVPVQEASEYFMVKWMSDVRPAGRFSFHPAFYAIYV